MRRLTLLLALLIAAPAGAAPLVERPFEPRPDRAVATCLRATGVPGGLAILGPLTRRDSATDLLTAGPEGTSLAARVRLGPLLDCAAVAQAPGGAAVLAGPVSISRARLRTEIRAVVRDPGGGFEAPVRLGRARYVGTSAAAVSPAGHAVVAWTEVTGLLGGPERVRIMAARRAPGGRFEAARRLAPWTPTRIAEDRELAAGVDAAGVATVAWGRRTRTTSAVEVAVAAPGAAFDVRRMPGYGRAPALAVAPDGWSVLAYDGGGEVRVLERSPGVPRFTAAPTTVGRGSEPSPAVAVRNGGGAVVAWRTDFAIETAGLAATARPGPGAFAAPRELTRSTNRDWSSAVVGLFGLGGAVVPSDPEGGRLRVALAPDGRALLAWTVVGPLGAVTPMAAQGSLDDGFAPPASLGTAVRDANGVAPVFLAGGAAAVAWTDNSGSFDAGFADSEGRLHLALEGAPPQTPATAPRVRLAGARVQRLYGSQPVRVTAVCDRACDLRVRSRPGGAVTFSLPAGSRRRIALSRTLASGRERRGRVRVRVLATAAGGGAVATESLSVRVHTRPALPVPAPRDVRARRRGRQILVTWRTDTPARRAGYMVEARRRLRGGSGRSRFVRNYSGVEGRGRTRFAVHLHPRRPAAIRWVRVRSYSADGGATPRPVTVPVR